MQDIVVIGGGFIGVEFAEKLKKDGKNVTIVEIAEKYPETDVVFHAYDTVAGECLLCNNLFESIEYIVEKYKLNANEIIGKLNSNLKKEDYLDEKQEI